MSRPALAVQVFAASGLAGLCRRFLTHGGRFVVMFHGVASRRYPELPPAVEPSFCRAELYAALAWIGARFAFLTPDDFLATDKPGVLVTFDDGFANQLHQALPVLEELAVPAVVFVTTQHVRDPRDWLPAIRTLTARAWPETDSVPAALAADLFDGLSQEELARLSRHALVTIGAHSVSHPFLTRVDDARLAHELGEAKRFLEAATGAPVDLLAYPTGDYDRRVAEAARAAGYRAAFADRPRGVGLPAFEVPRVGLYAAAPAYLAAKLSGLHRPPLRGAVPPRSAETRR